MITICLAYFKSLTLANLAAALYSVKQQDLACVERILVFDNDTQDSLYDVNSVVNELQFSIPVVVVSVKHGDATKTHAWSTNQAVNLVSTPWVLFTRADYILSFGLVRKFLDVKRSYPHEWNGFVTSNGCHLQHTVEECELTGWRTFGPRILGENGAFDYTLIDSGVWMARPTAFDAVDGLDERLTAWGHAQTDFQYRLYKSGVDFVRIPEVLFWHPHHGGAKDIDLAHRQLAGVGVNLKECWARYHGVSPYGN